ncbi:MAG: cupin domain-containing protein [Paracoccaceae bacterium]
MTAEYDDEMMTGLSMVSPDDMTALVEEVTEAALTSEQSPLAPSSVAFSVDTATLPQEGGSGSEFGANFGSVMWRTLVCADRTPSSDMVMGLAEFDAGGTLLPHRHLPAEVYYGVEGSGTVTIDGIAHKIAPGIAVFVPSNAEHGTVAGPEGLKFVYVFPNARFAEVDYRFSAVAQG